MDPIDYIYNGKPWKASLTVSDKNTFFHAAFGVRANEPDPYSDKRVKFRRMRWATFLTYFENDAMPPLLEDILGKCFSVNPKYQQASVQDQDQFESYVSGIMKADQDVVLEEIPIIASLENLKVVLFSYGAPEPVIINPNVEILGSYPNTEKSKGEVVLYLKGNAFARMNPFSEGPVLKSNESEAKTVNEVKGTAGPNSASLMKYKKGGSAGSEGVQFQVGLLTVFFLNALQKLTSWRLSTENTAAGKFDDVVLEWPEGATLLQAKHRQNKTKRITFEELISVNSKSDDFSLPKYFFSYQEVKKTFKLKNVIICTNVSGEGKVMKFLKAQKVDHESLLHYENCDCKFYTFSDEILPYLKENVRGYYEKNLQNKGVDKSAVTDENIRDFLEHLQFYSSYPPENDVGKVTEQLLSHMKRSQNLHGRISPLEIQNKILDWFQQKDGVYLNELYAKAIFSEIWRDKHWEKLEKYNVFFEHNNLNIQNAKQLLHFTVEERYLLQEIKIFRALQDRTKILFVNLDDDSQRQKQVLEAFGLPRYTILVLTCPTSTEERIIKEVSPVLREILDKYKYKKIVLVADFRNKIPNYIGLCDDRYDVLNESVSLEDLSADSQEMLLNVKNIVFQGKDISLKELFAGQVTQEYGRFLNSEDLEKLVTKEKVKVGAPPVQSDITQFYIKRSFRRSTKCENGTMTDEIVFEELICDMNEKVVLISDSAGTGKSTVLTNLATTMKKKYPHLWVIRIDLNNYTQILKDYLENNKISINVLELLNSKHSTKLTNHLERAVFSTNAKVVLMLDGFDEISPEYTELVLSLLSFSREQQNFAKIIVTTRPHLAGELNNKLQVEPFLLEPFTKQNQNDFLVGYWMHNLDVDNAERGKCEKYAKALIEKIFSRVQLFEQGTNHFGAIPLHARMLAEVFQENNQFETSKDLEGCKEYLIGDEIEPKLPENMNVTMLYKMFIEKKRSVFMDKGNPSGNTTANGALNKLFQYCMGYHRSLALESILDKTKRELFTCHRQSARNLEMDILKIGIVQKVDNEYHFAHRTFAEYFVADSLIKELQLPNQNADFQRFLIEEILLEFRFNFVCTFFNSFLQGIVNDLPSNIFHKYQSVSYEISSSDIHKFDLLHHLASNGYVAILQLILKCVDLNFIKEIPDFLNYFEENNLKPLHGNILNIVHTLVQQKGLEVKDVFEGQTLLEHATLFRQLEMVKFLVRQGADVNAGTFKPLYIAVNSGFFEMTKFLVEQGADVKAKHPFRHVTLLYMTIERNDPITATFLLDGILSHGINVNDSSVPYAFAYLGILDPLKKLMESRLYANSRMDNDETLIFGAARGGQLSTIRYLVEQGTDVNARDKWNNTALHVVAGNPRLFCTAELLVELGVDFNIQNTDSETAFHFAVASKNFDLMKLLVNRGTNVSLKYKDGSTVLHKAASIVEYNMVKFLVEKGVDIDSRDKNGHTALHLVILSSAALFRNKWPLMNSHDSAPCVNHLDIIKFLVEKGADIGIKDASGHTAFHLAVASGDLDVVRLLLRPGIDVNIKNEDGRTVLHLAFSNGFSHIVEFLVRNKVDVNARDKYGHTVVHYSVSSRDHLDVLKFILENNADVNLRSKRGRTALHLAAESGNVDAVVLLVERKVDVNIKDHNGNTALHLAVREGRLSVVEYLVKVGADITVENYYGQTALHLAAIGCGMHLVPTFRRDKKHVVIDGGESDFIKFLEEWTGADNSDGDFTRNKTEKNINLDIVKILVAKCSEIINIQDITGSTALHCAVLRGRLEVVEFLVTHNADVSIENRQGHTAMQLAADNDRRDIELLLEHNAGVK